jgi:hypothetical protein
MEFQKKLAVLYLAFVHTYTRSHAKVVVLNCKISPAHSYSPHLHFLFFSFQSVKASQAEEDAIEAAIPGCDFSW